MAVPNGSKDMLVNKFKNKMKMDESIKDTATIESVGVPETASSLGATVPKRRCIDGRVDADSMCSVCSNIVLVCTILPTLRSYALQLLLRRGVCIADLHDKMVLANRHAVEVLDDLLADIATLEPVQKQLLEGREMRRKNNDANKERGVGLTGQSQRYGCCPSSREGFCSR